MRQPATGNRQPPGHWRPLSQLPIRKENDANHVTVTSLIVTVSYLEWVQNIQQFSWQKERVGQELTESMRKAYAAVRKVADEKSIDLRTAAFVLAIQRVGAAAKARVYVEEDIQL